MTLNLTYDLRLRLTKDLSGSDSDNLSLGLTCQQLGGRSGDLTLHFTLDLTLDLTLLLVLGELPRLVDGSPHYCTQREPVRRNRQLVFAHPHCLP